MASFAVKSWLWRSSLQSRGPAEVSAPPEELDKIRKVRGPQSGLQAGLPVEVLIPLRKRSALAYLVEPLTQTFWRTGREH